MKPILTTIFLLSMLFASTPALAQGTPVKATDSFGDKPIVTNGTIDVSNGFIPCSGTQCSPCDLVVLFNTLLKWFMTIAFLIFAILAMKAGVGLVVSGSAGSLEAAKKSFTNAFIGLIIILAAWLIVDTLLRGVLKGGNLDGVYAGYGPWSAVQCVSQADVYSQAGFFEGDPHITASGDNAAPLTSSDVTSRIAGVLGTQQITGMSDAALDAAGITDPAQRKAYRALISQESVNCTNKTGPVTKYGQAFGCTQMLVGTARAMDKKAKSRFVGMSDSQVSQILLNDNTYSVELGALFYKEGLQKYNGNIDYTLARYNGGDKALNASKDCPGQRAYQCTINGAGYAQTRNYVANIKAIAAGI